MPDSINTVPTLPVQLSQVTNAAHKGAWSVEYTHAHEFHRMIWFTRGQGRITFGAKHRSYGPNSVVFLPSNTPYSFDVKPQVFGTIIDITALDFLEMPPEPLHIRIRDVLEQGRFVGLIENLQRELQANAPGQDRACVYHAGLIGVWLERTAANSPKVVPDHASSAKLVNKFQDMVEDRFSVGDNITDYAAALGVTPTHLTRCCQRCLGQSSLSVLNERILYEARDLLVSTDLPIKEVAQALGFASAAYFTRAFLAATKNTPSDFRASAR